MKVIKKLWILSLFFLFIAIGHCFAAPVLFDMETHPQDLGANVNISYRGVGSSSLNEGVLEIESNSSYVFYPQLDVTEYNDFGWVVQSTFRVVEASILQYDMPEIGDPNLTDTSMAAVAFIQISDDLRWTKLNFYDGKVMFEGYYREVEIDTRQFHTYRLVGDKEGLQLYIDGQLEINWKDRSSSDWTPDYLNLRSLSFGVDTEKYWSYYEGQSYPGVYAAVEIDDFEFDPQASATEGPTDSDGMYTLYMPEGYLDEGVMEFVGVLNSGSEAANGTCEVYYDDGTSETFSVVFPPHQRSTLIMADMGIGSKKRFSTVLKTDRRITATLIHYENGRALGANFTSVSSTRWSIAEGYATDHTRDILSLFNPNDAAVEVDVALHPTPWHEGKLTVRIGGKEKATVDIHEYIDEDLYPYAYGVTMTSDLPIVAALSRFDDAFGDGMLFMATPNFGEGSGFVAKGMRNDKTVEFVDLLNLNDFGISLELNIHYSDGITHTMERYVGGYGQWNSILLTDDGLVMRKGVPYAIEYKAYRDYYWNNKEEVPLIANFIHAEAGQMEGTRFQNSPHRYWEFAEGFRDADPDSVQEYLDIFNPSESSAVGAIIIYYDDGMDPTKIPFEIEPNGKTSFILHELDALRSPPVPGGISYGIRIDSNIGVIPYFSHHDTHIGGSFALNGTGWDF